MMRRRGRRQGAARQGAHGGEQGRGMAETFCAEKSMASTSLGSVTFAKDFAGQRDPCKIPGRGKIQRLIMISDSLEASSQQDYAPQRGYAFQYSKDLVQSTRPSSTPQLRNYKSYHIILRFGG